MTKQTPEAEAHWITHPPSVPAAAVYARRLAQSCPALLLFPCLFEPALSPSPGYPGRQRKTSVERGIEAVLLPVTLVPCSPLALETSRCCASPIARETGLFPQLW